MDWSSTGFSCIQCGERVQFAQETVVVVIAMAQLTEQGMVYTPLVVDAATDHDFLFEPIYLCEGCCSGHMEQLEEIVRDIPIVEVPTSITSCRSCTAGINQGEVVGKMTCGEVHRSKRSPNCQSGGTTFVEMDNDPIILCVSCINRLNSDVIDEMWSEPVQQNHECPEGTQMRCWRTGCPAEEHNPGSYCNANG